MRAVLTAIILGVAAISVAQAETVDSSPLVVLPLAFDSGEHVAAPGQPLLVQKVTSTRAAILTQEAPAPAGFARARVLPNGTKLFGVHGPERGWLYCGVATSTASWWAADAFVCYEDTDHDGDFDAAGRSGAPFMGVPLFVFSQGDTQPLATPVTYTPLPYADGPFVELSVLWSAVPPPRVRRNETPPPPGPPKVTLSMAYGVGEQRAPMSDSGLTFTLDQPRTFRKNGAEIVLLGMTPEGGLRYRVTRTMPKQIDRVTMQQIITYSTTYVPIYVPR